MAEIGATASRTAEKQLKKQLAEEDATTSSIDGPWKRIDKKGRRYKNKIVMENWNIYEQSKELLTSEETGQAVSACGWITTRNLQGRWTDSQIVLQMDSWLSNEAGKDHAG